MDDLMPTGVRTERILAASVGHRAWDVFESALSGTVIGVTSGGVFVRAGSDRVVFISRLDFRSPLTITLGADRSALKRLENGMAAECKPGELAFPQADLIILVETSALWATPPPASEISIEPAALTERLRDISARVLQLKGDAGLGGLLPELVRLTDAGYALDFTAERVLVIREALQEEGGKSLEKEVTALLGLGRGLTPSGDDLLVGFLLALNRWRKALRPSFDVARLNQQIPRAAFQTTTHLSANLIECGAAGTADERLLDGVDYLAAGRGDAAVIAKQLAEMGSSSGVDSLVGMALAFELCGMLLS
jgi:hypothetical protein